MGEVNYRVRQPGRRKSTQLYHINLLKQWRSGATPPAPASLVLAARHDIPLVPVGEDLGPAQKQDLEEVILQHQDVFSEVPGRTKVAQHVIKTAPGVTVRVPPYRVGARKNVIQEEVARMLQLRVIEESHSAWSSPIVLVPKPPLPPHPGPHQGVLAGAAHQNRSGEDGVCDPGGSISIYVPYIRVHGPPAKFQRMIDQLLRPHQVYAAAYIDDIIIHSASWDVHLRQLRAVLGELRKAGLTANPLGSGGDIIPGLPSRTGDCPTPGEQGRHRPGLAPPHRQETGEIVPGSGRVQPEIYPRLRHSGQLPE